MPFDPTDTIVALASVPAPGGRAIVRLSGPRAWNVAAAVFADLPPLPSQRLLLAGSLRLPGVASALPADLYFFPEPRSFTGEDVVELHTLGSPPLVELVVAECLRAGARAAQPGEFTLRAFLSGKLDLPRAEAVLGVIEARDRDELTQALVQLAGGLAQPLHRLREDLLNLLADVEAGLDFADEDLSFVDQEDLLKRLTQGLALVTLVRKQIEQRSTGVRPFRAVLVGAPNAGKSSLFNALAGHAAALVSPQPGTTRDFLRATLNVSDVTIEILDTAGLAGSSEAIDRMAQDMGVAQAMQADLLLWCREAGVDDGTALHPDLHGKDRLLVATKCDLAPAPSGMLVTSSATGVGLEALRQALADRARARSHAPLAPSLSRCRHHVEACLQHLRSAHGCVLNMDPPEILAVEVRAALDELGAMVGTVYTDDLLERIFSRFCIGK